MKAFWIEFNFWSPYYWAQPATHWYGWEAYGSWHPHWFRAWIDLRIIYLAIHWGVEPDNE
jgi:hypothetical protein